MQSGFQKYLCDVTGRLFVVIASAAKHFLIRLVQKHFESLINTNGFFAHLLFGAVAAGYYAFFEMLTTDGMLAGAPSADVRASTLSVVLLYFDTVE